MADRHLPKDDQEPETPEGVGESTTTHGEDQAKRRKEAGRQDGGRKGASGRPTGTSTARDRTGVDPQESHSG